MTESPAINSAKSSVDLAEAPIRVLSVDDEAGFLKITKQILEVHFAFQVDTASSVDEAMDKMKKTTYDVIVSDYQMPGKDGLQFLKELRDGENDVPFILFTGKGREEIAIESLNLGADGYFNKMGDSETVYGELVHGIRQAVEKKKAEQEVAKARDEYLSITNLTGDIIVNVDRKDRWTFLNDGACMFWGKPREELLGKTFRDYLHPEDYEKTAASAIQENIETRQIVRGVVNRQKTPKGWRTVEWNAAPLFDKSGEYVGMQATGRDITERKRAEEAIEHLARFPSENPNPVIRIAKDGVIIYANTAAKSLLSEWKREVGQSVPDFWRQKVATSFASGSSMRFEIECLDRVVSFEVSPVKNAGYVNAYGRDITERRKAEEDLMESEERFRLTLEAVGGGGWDWNIVTGEVYFSDSWLKSLGYKRDEVKPDVDFWQSVVHPDDMSRVMKAVTEHFEGKTAVYNCENRLRMKSGEYRYNLDRGMVVARDSEGKPLRMVGTDIDIIERKKAENLLQRSERRWVDSFNSLEDVMLIINTDYIIEKINDIGLKLFGKTREEVIGKKCFQILHNLDSSIEQCPFKRTLKTGKAESVDLYDKTFDKYFNVSCSPIFNERDEIVRHVDLIKDITESKKSEKALEESEERYRSLFESAREGITITDSEGKIVRMNDAFATMLGYDSAEELVGFSAVELYHDREARRILFEEIGERGYVEGYELTLKKRDGSPISVLGSSLTRKDEEGNITQTEGFFMDITERKKVENALEESEERYRRLFESVREGMIITGPEGKLLRVNRAAATMLGYDSPEELVGIPAVELYLDPKDREAMFKEIMRRGYVDHYEVIFKKRDGSPIYILGSNVTRKDEEGKILQIEAFFMDITERKTREEEMKRRLMRFRLDDGNLYLVKESSPALSLEAFKDLLNVGYHGLVFSRTPEEEFKKNVDGSFEFRWLAERGGDKSLSTFKKIENNLEKSLKKSVILLDGLDYLILKNGFKEALFFVQHLREFTHLTDNVVVLSVDPSTLGAREVRLLEKEGREVEPQVFIRLPEDLMEILRFIYEHNALGSKPNYTDIRQELSISKPTVGKRIKSLINTGYVTENPRGRSKVLELTYKGMRLFLK